MKQARLLMSKSAGVLGLWFICGLTIGCNGQNSPGGQQNSSTTGGEETAGDGGSDSNAATSGGGTAANPNGSSGGSTGRGGYGGETPGGHLPGSPVTCTLVIGYSQVSQWFSEGAVFESMVGDGQVELLWNGGAGVDRWRDPDYEGWQNELVSPCPTGSETPERAILSVSGPYGDDQEAWVEATRESVEQIFAKYPSVTEVVLQPVVGGPNHEDCLRGDEVVRASWQHAHIDLAIAEVASGLVVSGASPEVGSCEEYSDAKGHLTPAGSEAAAAQIATYYLDVGYFNPQ